MLAVGRLVFFLAFAPLIISEESVSFKFPSKRQVLGQSRNAGYIQQSPSYYQVPSYAPPPLRIRPDGYNPPQAQYRPSDTYQSGRETVLPRPQTPPVDTENVETGQEERVEEQTTTLAYGEAETTTRTTIVSTVATTARKPSRCFINEFGFKCCSVELMRLMLGELDHPQRSINYRGCNLQRSCTALQMEGQTRFNVSLECLVGGSDYPNKGSFLGNYMCKVRSKQGKVAVMYASPHQYTLGEGVSRPLSPQEFEIRSRNNGWSAEDLIETIFGAEDING